MKYSLLLLTALTLVLPAHAEVTPPKIEVPEAVFDFGTVAEGTRVKHDFVVKNTGGADLAIQQVIPACGCTAAVASEPVVKPGAEASIHVEFDSSGFSGDKSKATRVNTNDPDSPSVFVTVRGYIEPGVVVEPQRVQFGEIAREGEDMPSREVTIEARGGTVIKGITTHSKYLTLTERQSGDSKRVVSIALNPEIPNGELRDRLLIAVKSEGGERTVNVPVLGTVRGAIQLKPATVSFGILNGKSVVERSVRFENASKSPVEIISVSSGDPAVTVEVKPIKQGKISVLKVRVDPAKVQRDLRTSIEVKTNSAAQPTLVLGIYGILPPKG